MPHRPSRSRFDTGVSLRTALPRVPVRRQSKVLESMAAQRLFTLQQGGRAPIRAAVMTGGKGLAVRAATRVLGPRTSQIQAIIRQQVARVPVPARLAALGAGVFAAERGIEATTGRSPAKHIFDLTRGRGRDVFDTGKPAQRSRQMARGSQLAVGSELPPSHQVVKVWQTFEGGPVFARLADGHIAVQKKDGTIKHFRPYRPVVIPRKWNARSMSRVATALKRQRKTASKIMKMTGGFPGRK